MISTWAANPTTPLVLRVALDTTTACIVGTFLTLLALSFGSFVYARVSDEYNEEILKIQMAEEPLTNASLSPTVVPSPVPEYMVQDHPVGHMLVALFTMFQTTMGAYFLKFLLW